MRGLKGSAAMAATVVVMLLGVLFGVTLIRDGEVLVGVIVFAFAGVVSVVGGGVFSRFLERR